jgi:hypothetical protein
MNRLPWLAVLAILAYHWRRWGEDRQRAEALALARPDARPRLAGEPRVSILVAAWNERDTIAAHVASVRALRYPAVE